PRTRVECDKRHERIQLTLVYFNPRTRVECDCNRRKSSAMESNFNPRTRVECDNKGDDESWVVTYFNPRTRVECDNDPQFDELASGPFQSTHSCRVRQHSDHFLSLFFNISIHALV